MTDTDLSKLIIDHIVAAGSFDAHKTVIKLASIINQTLDSLPVGPLDVDLLKDQINFYLKR